MIGLSGTHGTGKTTLARAFAERQDIPLVLTTASGVYEACGLDPSSDYPIEIRIGVQEAILQAFEAQWAHATNLTPLFISDRTPLDLASYMLADIQRCTLAATPAMSVLITNYVERCYASLNRWFSTVLLVQPGIPLQEGRPGKAPACPAFMEHQNHLLRGLMGDARVECKVYVIGSPYTLLEDRLKCVGRAFETAFKSQTDAVAALKEAGAHVH